MHVVEDLRVVSTTNILNLSENVKAKAPYVMYVYQNLSLFLFLIMSIVISQVGRPIYFI